MEHLQGFEPATFKLCINYSTHSAIMPASYLLGFYLYLNSKQDISKTILKLKTAGPEGV